MAEVSIIEDLPIETFFKILNYVDPKDCLNLRLVSKKIKNDVGLKEFWNTSVNITNANWNDLKEVEFFNNVIFMSFTIRFTPAAPFTTRLRKITFQKIVLTNNLISILHYTPLIEHLKFISVYLDRETLIPVPNKISLPRLERLDITPFGWEETNSDNILLHFISGIEFKRLKTFCFFCADEIYYDSSLVGIFNGNFAYVNPLNEFLDKNVQTLRELCFGQGGRTVKLVSYVGPRNDYQPFQFYGISAHTKIPNDWNWMVRTQCQLRFLEIDADAYDLWECRAWQLAINQSQNRIEYVSLSGGGHPEANLNLNHFENCNNLQYLKIYFTIKKITGLERLPVSLRTLSLGGPLKAADICTIVARLQNLEYLTLDVEEPRLTNDSLFQLYGTSSICRAPVLNELIKLPKFKQISMVNTKFLESEIRSCLFIVPGIKLSFIRLNSRIHYGHVILRRE